MAKLDLYYRAFKDYRKITKGSADTLNERKAIIQQNPELDHFTTTKFICNIENDWVNEIEEGLKFFEKAIEEERQFIRVQGEQIPIEKVKKVSKASVEHLAKHSNLITHVPENPEDDVVPDELYIVEKLNDYAVYENRFLYMALKYLQDFISFRIDKIVELRSTYIGDFSIHKEVKSNKKDIIYETKIYEKREDNPYPIEDLKADNMIKRIKDCAAIVSALLGTPLMTEVGKTPLLKPPITKTNVLKMNNNFKKALALYEYVSAYKGLGYSFEEVKTDYHPFSDKNADEIIDTVALTSFITYKIGNDLEKQLETNYQEEERLKKEDEEKKLDERIAKLRKKAMESSKTMEEYMAMLEQRNQQLLHDSEELHLAKNEIHKLNQEIEKLTQERKELERRIDELKEEIEDKIREISKLNQKYIEDMMAIRKEHAEEIKEMMLEHETEVNELLANHRIELTELANKHQDELDELEEHNKGTIEDLKERYEDEISKYKTKVAQVNDSIKAITLDRDTKVKEAESRMIATIKECEEKVRIEVEKNEGYLYERDLYKGELNAKRIKEGTLEPCDEFASKDRFKELEQEFYAFERFFTKEWKLAKKKLDEQAKDKNSDLVKELLEEEKAKADAKAKVKAKTKEEKIEIEKED